MKATTTQMRSVVALRQLADELELAEPDSHAARGLNSVLSSVPVEMSELDDPGRILTLLLNYDRS